ncbi:MAG: GIY-YIG nuclease family protein [Alphaproteobacteria bacterium]|nr:GIY-YIG nuclease family protein [Alphaproteobacteria bacterium]
MRSILYTVYIIATQNNTTLYVGVSSDIKGRIWQHKNKVVKGFTKKYNVDKLVYYEIFEDVLEAIKREKQIKKYRREKKIVLIEKMNSQWCDLYEDVLK